MSGMEFEAAPLLASFPALLGGNREVELRRGAILYSLLRSLDERVDEAKLESGDTDTLLDKFVTGEFRKSVVR